MSNVLLRTQLKSLSLAGLVVLCIKAYPLVYIPPSARLKRGCKLCHLLISYPLLPLYQPLSTTITVGNINESHCAIFLKVA